MISKTGQWRRQLANRRLFKPYGESMFTGIALSRLGVTTPQSGYMHLDGCWRYVSPSLHDRINRRAGLELRIHYYTYEV